MDYRHYFAAFIDDVERCKIDSFDSDILHRKSKSCKDKNLQLFLFAYNCTFKSRQKEKSKD